VNQQGRLATCLAMVPMDKLCGDYKNPSRKIKSQFRREGGGTPNVSFRHITNWKHVFIGLSSPAGGVVNTRMYRPADVH
jgi:hypothetical protein